MQITLSMKLPTVYVLSNESHTVFYTGVTGHPFDRIPMHIEGRGCFFTSRYRTFKLMYFEYHTSLHGAIEREKQIKGWHREGKLELIRSINPNLRDMAGCFLPF